ncbi:Serine/threonine-protein kinase pkn3 [Myxococcus hansupus]|uniref:Serine/threonine-protein kinase pkn3 n=1 Tax=Pseudomyxococcus hansupus TaxID=1297742 RepID=A0A0H4WVL9_9BACT|nr:serine/threonine-protein kinase [Myxococcus hansupus]AKQ65653.1 Serine/threonine-protein kinase pkn3 [Myxococcus hansupus]
MIRATGLPPAPPELPGYEPGAPLGRGGFGRVFSARREADGHEVALKVLEPLAGERLTRELEALRRIGPPDAPALLGEATTLAGERVVIMERIEGMTLARQLAELPDSGALPWTEALPRLRGLAEAVARAHAVDVVHRDLKPENVMLSGARVVLLDFGLARLSARDDAEAPPPNLTRTGQRLGTHEYMSPEQCRDARYIDARSDLYSLGVVAFEMLCGRPPFVGESAAVLQAQVSRRPPALSTLAPWPVPAALDAVVQRLLAKAPEDRFGSARELAQALGELQGAADVLARTAPGPVGAVLGSASTDAPKPPPSAEKSGAQAETPPITAPGRPLDSEAMDAREPSPGAEKSGSLAETPPTTAPGSTVDSSSTGAPRQAPEVALLGIRGSVSAPALLTHLGNSGATLARVEAGLALFAFPHEASVDAGLRAALKAVELLRPHLPGDAALAIHCAPLRTRERQGRLTLGGSALERPERWWPAPSPNQPQEHLHLTAEARAHVGAPATGATPSPDVLPPEELLGRDSELAWLREGLTRVQAHGAPVLRTLLGEEGLGKTRLLATWRKELTSHAGVDVLVVESLSDEGSASESGLRSLICTVLGLPQQTSSDEALYRLLADAQPPVEVATVHPAARRQHVARAIAAHLGRLASARPLVLLVDDAHALDPTALDALELATLAGEAAPLYVVLTGRHRLLGMRPYLGERARDAEQLELPPLSDRDAREVLRQLLRPVDLIAEGVLRELVDRCGGSPLRMLETVRALRGAGAVRSRPDGGGYLAADALNALESERPGTDERLAERSLAALPSGLRALLQVAALLGDDVRLEELSATLAHLDANTSLDLSMDAGVAMERLARAGMLEPRGARRWRFEHTTLREAYAALLPTPVKRSIGTAALRALPETPTARRARLAEATGDLRQAASLHAVLAESARRAHRLLESERHYSAALALVSREDDLIRLELLSGRGRVRYRLQRIEDAVEDLRAARALAASHRNVVREADLLLEEATALDWQDDAAGSTALLEQALLCLKDAVPPELEARHALAQARVFVRREDITGAVPALEHAVEAARTGADTETQAIALSMLGAMLAWTDRLEEASNRFDEAITLCEQTGDTLHLGVALNNRMVLHVQRRDASGARADLERAVSLGRELGNVQIERTSAFNLALLLGYQGRAGEALPLARRAGVLSQRFFPRSMAQDALLVARLCCELDDLPEVSRQLEWLEEPETRARLSPPDSLMCSVVRRVVDEARGTLPYAGDAWARLVDASTQVATPDERLEILVWAARAARAAGDVATLRTRVEEVEATAKEAPLWTDRVRALVEAA